MYYLDAKLTRKWMARDGKTNLTAGRKRPILNQFQLNELEGNLK